ncbi:MAG: flippase [Candidatus Doudnabacteria bacterium]|nr:flippase [Candidatus Doudnabacteria bacterium]
MSLAIKNIFWLTASRFIALFLLLIAYSQLFRYLGPYGSGQYQFVLSYVLIFSTVVDFGVQQFITKKMSEEPQNTVRYFRDFLRFEVFAAFVLYGVLLLVGLVRGYEPVVMAAVAVTGLGMVANALTYPYLSVMTANQDLKKVAFINFLNSSVNISIIFLAIVLKKYIVFLASVQLIFGILDLILYRIFTKKYLVKNDSPVMVESKPAGATGLLQIIKHAWPFAILVGFSAIYNRIDVIIITRMLGFEQTGFYTAAYKFLDILNFFPASVSHVLFPVLATLMVKGLITNVKQTLEKYIRLMVAIALPMAVGGSILAKPLVILLAGKEFESSAPVLSILIWAAAILFIYIPVNSLIISQLTKKAALVTGLNVLLNVAGNILLIPYFGIKAAAGMTVVSEILQGIFYFYFVKRNITDFSFFPILWRPVLAAGIMGVAVWFVRDMNLIVSLSAGILVYLVCLIGFGFVKKEELMNLKL